MTWIKTIEPDGADETLSAVFDEITEVRGKLSNLMKAQSLNPLVLKRHLNLYDQLMFGHSSLSRAEREAIAVVVSNQNHCDYCIEHHSATIEHYIHDETIVAQLKKDHSGIHLSGRLSAILNYAVKLTRKPSDVDENDIETLRLAELNDEDILAVNLTVAYYNFVNRIALGLGVEHSQEEARGYKDSSAQAN